MFGQTIFVGLNPVHSDDQMCLDIQSLINLYPFFQPEQLLAWAGMESGLFLNGIRNGKLEGILNRLYDADSAADLEDISEWHVGEYIASGGSLMWFAGMVKAVAKQHLNRLGSRADKFRAPVPSGRYYIFPAAVGNREVAEGHIWGMVIVWTTCIICQNFLVTFRKILIVLAQKYPKYHVLEIQ